MTGWLVPKLWAWLQRTFCATTAYAKDRFIQLSTIDDDLDDEFDM
jgi:hypothetical protein